MITSIKHDDPQIDTFAGPSVGDLGRGGMVTKIIAAKTASLSGTSTIIANGKEDNVICRIDNGESVGTYMEVDSEPQTLRRRWIMSLKENGNVTIDEGASKALRVSGKSLLPIGVIKATGTFKKGDMIACKTTDGDLIAYGLTNYSKQEVDCIMGKNSTEIKNLLDSAHEEEIIHRDNLAIV